MSKSDLLEFDIAPVQIPVRIAGRGYVMGAASAASAAKWQSSLLAMATIREDGSVTAIGANIMELDFPLLAACLRHATLDDTSRVLELKEYLTVEEIQELPNIAVIALSKRLKKMSGMDITATRESLLEQKAEIEEKLAELDKGDPAKNLPSITMAGSV